MGDEGALDGSIYGVWDREHEGFSHGTSNRHARGKASGEEEGVSNGTEVGSWVNGLLWKTKLSQPLDCPLIDPSKKLVKSYEAMFLP